MGVPALRKRGGKSDRKARASAAHILSRNTAVMPLDDLSGDRQSQPCAACAGARREEEVEDFAERLRRDPGAGVFNNERDGVQFSRMALTDADADRDTAADAGTPISQDHLVKAVLAEYTGAGAPPGGTRHLE